MIDVHLPLLRPVLEITCLVLANDDLFVIFGGAPDVTILLNLWVLSRFKVKHNVRSLSVIFFLRLCMPRFYTRGSCRATSVPVVLKGLMSLTSLPPDRAWGILATQHQNEYQNWLGKGHIRLYNASWRSPACFSVLRRCFSSAFPYMFVITWESCTREKIAQGRR